MALQRKRISRRRTIKQGGAVALLAATASSTAAASTPDADLLALGAQLELAWAKMRAWDEASHTGVTDAEVTAVMVPANSLVGRIEMLPARKLAGLRVKARAVSWCNSGERIDDNHFSPEGSTADAQIAASIVRDLLSFASLCRIAA